LGVSVNAECRERPIRRWERRCRISSFFSAPRACLLIGFARSILHAPAMAGYLSAYGGASTTQTLSDDPHRSDPAVSRQQEPNDHMVLAERSTNRV